MTVLVELSSSGKNQRARASLHYDQSFIPENLGFTNLYESFRVWPRLTFLQIEDDRKYYELV